MGGRVRAQGPDSVTLRDELGCGVQGRGVGEGEREAKAIISGCVYLLVLQVSLAGGH